MAPDSWEWSAAITAVGELGSAGKERESDCTPASEAGGGVEEIVENELRIRAGGGDVNNLGCGVGGVELDAELTAKAKDEGRREGEGEGKGG
jgi:hypothetical protein